MQEHDGRSRFLAQSRGTIPPLDPHGILRADWDYIVGSGDNDQWRLVGDHTLRVRFEALARRAGRGIDPDGSKDPLLLWLADLRAGPYFHFGAYFKESNPDGSDGAHHQMGSIAAIRQASADHCNELESEALKVAPSAPELFPPTTPSPGRQLIDALNEQKRMAFHDAYANNPENRAQRDFEDNLRYQERLRELQEKSQTLDVGEQGDIPSVVTSKPAIEGHFKTGQRTASRTELVVPRQ